MITLDGGQQASALWTIPSSILSLSYSTACIYTLLYPTRTNIYGTLGDITYISITYHPSILVREQHSSSCFLSIEPWATCDNIPTVWALPRWLTYASRCASRADLL
jgi:hypothetical protein